MNRPEWSAVAASAMETSLEAALGHLIPLDTSLCHGWSGLLRITEVMAEDAGGEPLRRFTDELRLRVLGNHDPESAFGYRTDLLSARLAPNDPGVLSGAAGIALALAAGPGRSSVTGWEDAFLLT